MEIIYKVYMKLCMCNIHTHSPYILNLHGKKVVWRSVEGEDVNFAYSFELYYS